MSLGKLPIAFKVFFALLFVAGEKMERYLSELIDLTPYLWLLSPQHDFKKVEDTAYILFGSQLPQSLFDS